jgi:hypothetical protein
MMATHDSQRRTVLCGALAAGVTLVLGTNAAAAAKLSKATAKYQTEPNGEQRCATCAHFESESNTCKVVEGDISPEGWCTLWLAAAGAST